MKGTSTFVRHMLLRTIAAGVLGILAFGQISTHAATETARVVKYSQDDIVTVHAKLRYSTLIVLPENEEILDFTTGDKDFWIINGAHNLCYIHPAKAGIRSNLNLITASGPQWSGQKRPTVVRSKPANGCGPEHGSFIPSSLDQASPFSFSSFLVRISGCDRGVAAGRAWR